MSDANTNPAIEPQPVIPPAAAEPSPAPAAAPSSEAEAAAGDPPAPPVGTTADEGTLFSVESLQMPEGFTLDTEEAATIVGVINDSKLTAAERGAKLQEFYLASTNKILTNIQAAVVAEFDGWRKDLENDPVLGGRNWPETETAVASVLQEFATPGFTDLINKTGIGNHKDFAQFLVNVAKITGEGKPIVGAPTSSAATRASILYPNQGQK